MEAQVEALERKNRLLEAALMAVLNTGGVLNGCPCGMGLKNTQDDAGSSESGSRRKSDRSTASRRSALDVFKETRAANSVIGRIESGSTAK